MKNLLVWAVLGFIGYKMVFAKSADGPQQELNLHAKGGFIYKIGDTVTVGYPYQSHTFLIVEGLPGGYVLQSIQTGEFITVNENQITGVENMALRTPEELAAMSYNPIVY